MSSDGPGVARRAKSVLGRSLRAVNHYAGDALRRLPDGSSAVLMYHRGPGGSR